MLEHMDIELNDKGTNILLKVTYVEIIKNREHTSYTDILQLLIFLIWGTYILNTAID